MKIPNVLHSSVQIKCETIRKIRYRDLSVRKLERFSRRTFRIKLRVSRQIRWNVLGLPQSECKTWRAWRYIAMYKWWRVSRHLPFPQASLDLVNISYLKEHRRRTEIACISLLSTESPSWGCFPYTWTERPLNSKLLSTLNTYLNGAQFLASYENTSFLNRHCYVDDEKSSRILITNTRVGTLMVATIYLQLIQNRYMFRSFTVLQCSHQHCVQPVASDV